MFNKKRETEIPGIKYLEDYRNKKLNPNIDSEESMYQIPFFKEDQYFASVESYQKFLKAVEAVVRKSDRYAKYKNYLVNDIKLNHCQVLKDITVDDATIEMHHGPIFTLYDYCRIVLEWYLYKGMKITTMRIADTVLREHEENHVQVVMLSQTIHDDVGNRNIFLNTKQAWGDVNAFISRYIDAIPPDLKEKFNRYIDRSMMSESDDYGLLRLNSKLWETKFDYVAPEEIPE